MRVKVSVLGAEGLQFKMNRIGSSVQVNMANAVNEVMREVFVESQHAVPVDTGTLKASARITPAKPGPVVSGSIGYGGAAGAYALPVHETHRTKAKYLERPARENVELFRDEMVKAIQMSIK